MLGMNKVAQTQPHPVGWHEIRGSALEYESLY